MRTYVSLALAAVLLIAADKPNKAVKSDQDKVQGTWSVTSLTVNGKRTPEALVKKLRVVFKGNRIIIKPWIKPLTDALGERHPDGDKVRFWLDSSDKPKTIINFSYQSTRPDQKGKAPIARPDARELVVQPPPMFREGNIDVVRISGIYALDGDRLQICWGSSDKLTEFSSMVGSRRTLLVLKRRKK